MTGVALGGGQVVLAEEALGGEGVGVGHFAGQDAIAGEGCVLGAAGGDTHLGGRHEGAFHHRGGEVVELFVFVVGWYGEGERRGGQQAGEQAEGAVHAHQGASRASGGGPNAPARAAIFHAACTARHKWAESGGRRPGAGAARVRPGVLDVRSHADAR